MKHGKCNNAVEDIHMQGMQKKNSRKSITMKKERGICREEGGQRERDGWV